MEDEEGGMTEGVFPSPLASGKSYREVRHRACGGRKKMGIPYLPREVKGTPTEELLIYLSGMITVLPSSPCLHRKKWPLDRLISTP